MSEQKTADSLDEIDQIMNEIEELQTSMTSAHDTPTATETPADDSMAEFQAPGGSDVSMEETLANLKDDEPSGPNLIDQAIEAQSAEAEAPVSEAEVLDEIEDSEIEEIEMTEEAPKLVSLNRTTAHSTSSAQGEASVAISLAGSMTLKLSYEFEGQDVTIGFVDGALRVELSDGTEFKIPVRRQAAKKAA